tara:strand:+ start:1349 stop:1741 length:393 start_codon:yes stop_codon:yes gene_type:complete
MQKENYLYFAKTGTAGDAANDAACFPVSHLLGTQVASATTTKVFYTDSTNLTGLNGTSGKVNQITLTHANISATANIHKEVARAIARIAANPGKGKVLTVVDTASGVVAEEFEAINDGTQITCTGIQITQ